MKIKTLFSCVITLALLSSLLSPVQAIELTDQIPIDPQVRIGKLDNGFTYYIRQNKKPEARVEMRLVVNAGSILEDDDQLGLAHFCEHMAFNGSEHFNKNELVSYLQSLGIRFGADLNAYTSFDETVYKLTVPSDKKELIDSGFQVMRDWAQGVSYEEEEIDKERGVIVEEWRLGRGSDQRMRDKYLPIILHRSHYANRLAIGKREIIENAPYEALTRFYKDWYRPDLMSIIIVGDMDPDYAEVKIKEHFSSLAILDERREREDSEVPDHSESLVCITTDEEASQTFVRLFFKHDVEPRETVGEFLQALRYNFFTQMLSQRLQERSQEANPPFIYGGSYWTNHFVRTKAAYIGYALVADDGVEKGLRALLVENKRVADFGFTQTELDRQKANMLKYYEKAYLERDKTESGRITQQYLNHFLKKDIPTSPEYDLEIAKQYLNEFTLQEINALAKKFITAENRVLVVLGPEKVTETTNETRLYAIMTEVDVLELKAYEDTLGGSTLLTEMPAPGKVVSVETIDSIDTKHVVLSNGVNVYLKKTEFKNDEILFLAFSDGGTSLYELKDRFSARFASSVVSLCGYGSFSPTDLGKLLAGKTVRFNTSINQHAETMSGSCRPQDLETFFQLLHLGATQPRDSEDAFSSFVSRMSAFVENQLKNPQVYFKNQYGKIMSQDHPRAELFPTVADIGEIDHQRSLEIFRERFSDADDFTMTIVGNFDESEILDMLGKYVASLPSKPESENWVDLGIRPPDGMSQHSVFKGQDEKSMTLLDYTHTIEYTDERELMLKGLQELLNIRLVEVIREELSGVYDISVSTHLTRVPYERATLNIRFPSAPENVDRLKMRILEILNEVKKNGVSEENIGKIRETMKRSLELRQQKNQFWLNEINDSVRWGKDFTAITDTSPFDTITSESIQKVFNECFVPEEYTQVTLYPEATE